jgi:diguanylate cyclase (GGDEF)-like protein
MSDQETRPAFPSPTIERLVYLVSPNQAFAGYVAQQINHFGYSLHHVRSPKNLANIFTDQHAIAILIEIPSEDDLKSDWKILDVIRQLPASARPLIFIAEQDDQAVRLMAIKMGGTAFFTKPINIVSLIDRLDSLHRIISSPPASRVLIIEDQLTIASYYQMILKSSGMDAQIADRSGNILESVMDFHPDLILIDTFIRDINASDLARVIRQIDEFVSVPIIFLSGEDDLAKRIEVLDLGADDFLIKPIKAAELRAVVRSRLERSKILRSFMVRDSLTSLLNHTSFRNILVQEVNRSKRQFLPLSLAMLDIDHFKLVNDTYGHSIGDGVIKGLSRLLQQRLRGIDVIGRYGGDEFVVLMVGCKDEQSYPIMNEIRQHFSGIEFRPANIKPFTLTFSGGISAFPKFQTAETLIEAADQALYLAKANGRNQIKIS